eukprot:gb/GECG01011928.1/.p1 GENE.gb/GECG01011928.1/~~gb/GECG01011928.1/.p1  ORF type:complete len:401 (+),score=46.94 gb/GECG01011928.1/:1-1203(+)
MMGILRRHGPPVGSVGGCLLVLFLIWTLSTALMAHATGNNQHAEDAGLSTGSVAYLRKTGEGSPDAEEQSSEGGPTEKQLDKTFDKIDSDNSGKIDRKEFKWFARGNIEGLPGLPSLGVHRFWDALTSSIAMTIVTELGDKTFCIAAIMAMQRSRYAVFIGAALALVVMTGLSVGIGYALPALLPKFYTHLASIVLFVYFGLKLLWDARSMSTGSNAELEEAEEELAASFNSNSSTPKSEEKDIENAGAPSHKRKSKRNAEEPKSPEGGRDNSPAEEKANSGGNGRSNSPDEKSKEKVTHESILDYLKFHWATLTSLFTMTFLAEWGDRSQIATIAMSSSKDPLGVALGGVIGHLGCTAIAVIGGRILASKISERTLSLCGGALFLLFAVLSILQGPQEE